MGWANCGVDVNGRPIGYAHKATCDEDGCDTAIHRGLAYACGGMHGEDSGFCDRYFCYDHLIYCPSVKYGPICQACAELAADEYAELDPPTASR